MERKNFAISEDLMAFINKYGTDVIKLDKKELEKMGADEYLIDILDIMKAGLNEKGEVIEDKMREIINEVKNGINEKRKQEKISYYKDSFKGDISEIIDILPEPPLENNSSDKNFSKE